jgi:hypothetical protein
VPLDDGHDVVEVALDRDAERLDPSGTRRGHARGHDLHAAVAVDVDAPDQIGDGGVAADGDHALDAVSPAAGCLQPLAAEVAREERGQGDRRQREDHERAGDVELEAVGDDADGGEEEDACAGDPTVFLAAGAEEFGRVRTAEAEGQRPDHRQCDGEPGVGRGRQRLGGPHHHHHQPGDKADDDVHADQGRAVAAHPAGLVPPTDDRARGELLRRNRRGRDSASSRRTQFGMTCTGFDEHGPPSPAATTDRDDRATPQRFLWEIRCSGEPETG